MNNFGIRQFGEFYRGTKDWHTITLTDIAPMDAVRGDIIIELWGMGTLYVDWGKYYLTE